MRKLLVAVLLLTMMTPCLKAQKKELSQARSYIKSSKFVEAENLMTSLLKDTTNQDNKRIHQMRFEAVHGQYEQANERMYLKQKQDTLAFFNLLKRLFIVAETLDSLDARPDSKGRVAPEYRQKHAALLHQYRSNIFNGGAFLTRKGQWKQAYDFYEVYLDCARQPLFADYYYDSLDVRMPEAAYWATYDGYKMNDAVLTLRHRHLALKDSTRAPFTLQYIAEARRWLKDDELYLETLKEGFRLYPHFPYFFPRLVDFYNARGQYTQSLAVCDSALVLNDSSELYLYAKSSALLQLERYGDCVKVSEKLISINDSLPEVYYNVGMAYTYIADRAATRKQRKVNKSNYQKAKTYMERYRKMKPDEQQKWAPALYRIYLNLNMGKQFDEIDRLLKNTL